MSLGYLYVEGLGAFKGEIIGKEADAHGELVFTTSPSGYLKSITDPSYTGQILIFSFPYIGSYGVEEAGESPRPMVRAVVINHVPESKKDELSRYLDRWSIPGIILKETRPIVDFIRKNGNKLGSIGEKHFEDPYAENLLDEAICERPSGEGNVLLIDLGFKGNILRFFNEYEIKTVPYNLFKASELKGIDGIIVSNGPGNPSHSALRDFTRELGEVLGEKPVLGICLGHQLVSLSLGMTTEKMKFGHRSINHPVEDLKRNRIGITTHNHGFAVIFKKGKGVEERYRSLNDGTNEGLEGKKILTAQFHPEGGPGPIDELGVFMEFKKMMQNG